MALRYTDRPYGGYGPQQEKWQTRFPANSQPMSTAPSAGGRPVLLYEPNGHCQYGIYHMGAWRGGENFRDPFTGKSQWRMNGTLINNPVRWASS